VIERAAILGGHRRLEIRRALGAGGSASSPTTAPSAEGFPTLDAAIRSHIERALAQCRGKIDGAGGAARLLAINPNTLRSKMAKLGIDPARFRP
jgi:DNA-binding NtrC family response regulator